MWTALKMASESEEIKVAAKAKKSSSPSTPLWRRQLRLQQKKKKKKLPVVVTVSSNRGGGVALKVYRCPHCSYSSSNLKLVRGHMVKHGPARLKCGYCDYRGHYPSRLHKHMRCSHSGLPFKFMRDGAGSSGSPAKSGRALQKVKGGGSPAKKVKSQQNQSQQKTQHPGEC